MPSFMGVYPGCASNREGKLRRALKSIRDQSFRSFEVWVVADGCERTEDIVKTEFPEFNVSVIPKQKLWSGNVRNRGIVNSSGEFIAYVDSDDMIGPDHLKIIDQWIGEENFDWVFFNDIVFKGTWTKRACTPFVKGKNGTSNIVHKKYMNGVDDVVLWHDTGYEHDWNFVQALTKTSEHGLIIHDAAQYYVCHIPGGYSLSYDL